MTLAKGYSQHHLMSFLLMSQPRQKYLVVLYLRHRLYRSWYFGKAIKRQNNLNNEKLNFYKQYLNLNQVV